MARALKEEQLTPADELRSLLTDSENLVAKLRGSRDNAEHLLANLDRIVSLWPHLEAEGADLRPEAGRWDTIQAQLKRHEGELLGALRAAGGMRSIRDRAPAEHTAWWWKLDITRRERIRRKALRSAAIVMAVAVVGVAIVAILKVLFPVDPNVARSSELMLVGENKMEEGIDIAGAQAAFREAVSLTPDDPDAWLWLGCAQEKSGDTVSADESYRKAQALYADETDFRLSRAQVLLNASMPAQAETDVTFVLAREPENARAYYLLATVAELQGNIEGALTALEQSAAFSENDSSAELTVMARYRYAMLLQQYQVRSMAPESTATPAP